MTKNRFAIGMSAAFISLGLAFAPAALAQDKMSKDGMKKEDGMKKDSMSKDDGMKNDGMMAKDGMAKREKGDGMMKKDDGMKK